MNRCIYLLALSSTQSRKKNTTVALSTEILRSVSKRNRGPLKKSVIPESIQDSTNH